MIGDCNLGLVPLEISSITDYVLPLKLLEYISMGVPSITVRNTAIGYYFGDDDCLFYDPEMSNRCEQSLIVWLRTRKFFAGIRNALQCCARSSYGAAKSRST